jgi:hypothetical protein
MQKTFEISLTYRMGQERDWTPSLDYSGEMVTLPKCISYKRDGKWLVLDHGTEIVEHNLEVPGNEVVSILVTEE